MSNGSQRMKFTEVYKKEKDEFGEMAVFIGTKDDIGALNVEMSFCLKVGSASDQLPTIMITI